MIFGLKLLLASVVLLEAVFGMKTDKSQAEFIKLNEYLKSNQKLLAHAGATKSEMGLHGWDYREEGNYTQAVGVVEVTVALSHGYFEVALELDNDVAGCITNVKVAEGIPFGPLVSLDLAVNQVEHLKQVGYWPRPKTN